MIEWYRPSSGVPKITIASYGITLQKETLNNLNRPKFVQIGYDKELNQLAIKASSDDNELMLYYVENQNYVRLNVKDYVKTLGISKTLKSVIGEIKNDMIVFNLNESEV